MLLTCDWLWSSQRSRLVFRSKDIGIVLEVAGLSPWAITLQPPLAINMRRWQTSCWFSRHLQVPIEDECWKKVDEARTWGNAIAGILILAPIYRLTSLYFFQVSWHFEVNTSFEQSRTQHHHHHRLLSIRNYISTKVHFSSIPHAMVAGVPLLPLFQPSLLWGSHPIWHTAMVHSKDLVSIPIKNVSLKPI